ncbi:Mismatch repair ATPase MSH6 [Pseudoloma neurophilia]|uniref:DNA mismatch repair protein n=1 Tax=Pseudoloma neurophilia TaxID=146866 RepID=A0A0R0M4N2_9MICR|nr:Mismatch repair ATPase MSH6 [Pseudoloma neurophilia]
MSTTLHMPENRKNNLLKYFRKSKANDPKDMKREIKDDLLIQTTKKIRTNNDGSDLENEPSGFLENKKASNIKPDENQISKVGSIKEQPSTVKHDENQISNTKPDEKVILTTKPEEVQHSAVKPENKKISNVKPEKVQHSTVKPVKVQHLSLKSSPDLNSYSDISQNDQSKDTTKKNEEKRFPFLATIRDSQKRPQSHPDYDPTTLFISDHDFSLLTPFERQYWAIKKEYFNVICCFKKGKFYELFEQDALIANRLFNLRLTNRVNMTMAGYPITSYEYFLNKFIENGYSVGRIEQTETVIGKRLSFYSESNGQNTLNEKLDGKKKDSDSIKGKKQINEKSDKNTDDKLIKRELVEIVTPSTAISSTNGDSLHFSFYLSFISKSLEEEYIVLLYDAALNQAQFHICNGIDRLHTLFTAHHIVEVVVCCNTLKRDDLWFFNGTVSYSQSMSSQSEDSKDLRSKQSNGSKDSQLEGLRSKQSNDSNGSNDSQSKQSKQSTDSNKTVTDGALDSVLDRITSENRIKKFDKTLIVALYHHMSKLMRGSFIFTLTVLSTDYHTTVHKKKIETLPGTTLDTLSVIDTSYSHSTQSYSKKTTDHSQYNNHSEYNQKYRLAIESDNTLNNTFNQKYTNLYTVLNKCNTSPGRRLFRQWLVHLLTDYDEIIERRNITQAMVQIFYHTGDLYNTDDLYHTGDHYKSNDALKSDVSNIIGSNVKFNLSRRLSELYDMPRLLSNKKNTYSLLDCIIKHIYFIRDIRDILLQKGTILSNYGVKGLKYLIPSDQVIQETETFISDILNTYTVTRDSVTFNDDRNVTDSLQFYTKQENDHLMSSDYSVKDDSIQSDNHDLKKSKNFLEYKNLLRKNENFLEYKNLKEQKLNIEKQLNSYRESQEKRLKTTIVFKDIGQRLFQLEMSSTINVPDDFIIQSSTSQKRRYYTVILRQMIEKYNELVHRLFVLEQGVILKINEDIEGNMSNLIQISDMVALFDTYDCFCKNYLEITGNNGRYCGIFTPYKTDLTNKMDLKKDLRTNKTDLRTNKNEPTDLTNYVEGSLEEKITLKGLRSFLFDSVPLDISMNNNTLLLTGPNMAGKSTLMRMVGQAVVINQLGLPIFITSGTLPIFDNIFTRLGSADNLILGQSTFYMEMLQTLQMIKRSFYSMGDLIEHDLAEHTTEQNSTIKQDLLDHDPVTKQDLLKHDLAEHTTEQNSTIKHTTKQDLLDQNSVTKQDSTIKHTTKQDLQSKESIKSLLLIDELGRGTSKKDGLALAQSVLKYIISRNTSVCIFSTHFNELDGEMDRGYMQTVIGQSENIDSKESQYNSDLTFLYKFKKGVCQNSQGLIVGRMAGISQSIIDRAYQVKEQINQEKERHMKKLFQ